MNSLRNFGCLTESARSLSNLNTSARWSWRFLGMMLLAAGATLPAAAAEPSISIKPRYYSWTAAPGLEWTEKNTGYAWANWEIPLSQTALILLDVWEGHYLTDTSERIDQIVRQNIAPLLKAAREQGMTVIHCPGPLNMGNHPNLLRYPEALQQEPSSAAAWPPKEFRNRTGPFEKYRHAPAPPERVRELAERRSVRRIHPAVVPIEGEPVILTGDELNEHLRRKGVLFLFFAGFNTNACLFTRSYSAWEMNKRGYAVSIIRDGTTAMESFETADTLQQTTNAILMLEMFGKYSVTSDELRSALLRR